MARVSFGVVLFRDEIDGLREDLESTPSSAISKMGELEQVSSYLQIFTSSFIEGGSWRRWSLRLCPSFPVWGAVGVMPFGGQAGDCHKPRELSLRKV